MILKLQKISVLPVAFIFCGLHTVVGFILGVIVSMAAVMTNDEQATMGLGMWSMLVFPVVNAVLGFLAGAFIAGMYNFMSQCFGGIKFEFEQE